MKDLKELDYDECNDWESGRHYFTTITLGNSEFRIAIDQAGDGADLDEVAAKIKAALS